MSHERRQKFEALCRAAAMLARTADDLGMRDFRLTVTPLDFNMLQRDALIFSEDDSLTSRPTHLASLPVEVKW